MPGASALTVSCATVAKAKLLAVKYVSDLESLPGVSTIALLGPPALTAHAVRGLGLIAAVRDVVNALALSSSRLISKSEVQVPMYLDRWDKFGFRVLG